MSEAIFSRSKHRGEKLLKQFRRGRSPEELSLVVGKKTQRLWEPRGIIRYPRVFDQKMSEAIFSRSKHRGEKLLKQFRWGGMLGEFPWSLVGMIGLRSPTVRNDG